MMRCDCCDLLVESCGKAAEQRARAALQLDRERLASVGFRPAHFAGTCGDCGERVAEGDMIAPARCGTGWRGECCP